ncbi:GntR family transcriptional regulator [Candidatus Formimonas warabiya]|uniref:GntR family transcriptional regulator n=1 Tax=Formimonas warabiya TaxID=1761012 RepID=A0A3G1KWV6_FORW1|nr:GntR family transcriptional regulator [Candidatus Formimonas warabiya]ATW26978.1 GntR family transcriptional regulator [Candidatus Formimonas warabiya]
MRKRLLPVNLESYKPLREIVFETIREAIISGHLKPGERLMEVQLAEEMGVSRTPVREAIRKLELEAFVVMVPRKGAYVAGISLKDIADVFEVRAAMDSLAAGLAAERITDEELESLERALVSYTESSDQNDLDDSVYRDTSFHDIIYQASRNERLIQIVNNLREQIQRFRATSLAFPGRMKIAVDEHKKIVEALSERNIALSQSLAQEHVENAENSMLEALQKNGRLTKLDHGE